MEIKMAEQKPIENIGFEGFVNRKAKFANKIVTFQNGEFVEVK
jgi:hypothetical protein